MLLKLGLSLLAFCLPARQAVAAGLAAAAKVQAEVPASGFAAAVTASPSSLPSAPLSLSAPSLAPGPLASPAPQVQIGPEAGPLSALEAAATPAALPAAPAVTGQVFASPAASSPEQAQAELPPAGPMRRMDLKKLLSLPVEWEEADIRARSYSSLSGVLSAARTPGLLAELRRSPEAMTFLMDGMYMSLRSVLKSGLPDRHAVAVSMAQRYQGFLETVAREPGMPEQTARVAREAKADFFAENAFIEEFSRRQAMETEMARLAPPQATADPRPGQPIAARLGLPWRISQPVAESDRVRTSRDVTVTVSLAGELQTLQRLRQRKEKLEARLRLAQLHGMAKAFVDARAAELSAFLEGELAPALSAAGRIAPRITEGLFHNQFVYGRAERPAQARRSQGLRLDAEPGGFVIRAAFESDLTETRVLETFKRSIEDYWRGDFEVAGKLVHLRAEVSVRRLAPGQKPSAGALRLSEAARTFSRPGAIWLARQLDYAAAAHEFGHVLGLPDEYVERYDGPQRLSSIRKDASSLMSSLDGVVQPRHLRQVYELLSRR